MAERFALQSVGLFFCSFLPSMMWLVETRLRGQQRVGFFVLYMFAGIVTGDILSNLFSQTA